MLPSLVHVTLGSGTPTASHLIVRVAFGSIVTLSLILIVTFLWWVKGMVLGFLGEMIFAPFGSKN